jgi:superfamily II DNA/RNA helicase
LPAGEIHSDISQNKREATLRKFRDGQISVLVATDVAARGLDVPTISHVYNYDLPLSAADYVHRIGRTGRAGRSGIAISFVSDEQRYLVPDIEKVTGRELDPDSPFRKTRDGAKNSKNSRNHKSRSGSANTNRNRGYSNNGGRNFGTRERTHSAVAGVHAESGDFSAPQIQTQIQTKDRVESKFGARAKEFGGKSKEYGGKSKELGGKSKEFGSKSKQFGGKSREHSKSEGFESFFKESYDEVFSGSKSRPAFGQKARQGQGSRNGQSASSRHGQGHSANNHKPSRNKLVKIGKKRGSR